ncbi:MAG: TraR/DksA family transcriptional regulator [Treponema sp.]|jgi:RNA polymerase-binding protein DksA|nr:TraR/DksA family transcriptional regulator [Treponema sp.]
MEKNFIEVMRKKLIDAKAELVSNLITSSVDFKSLVEKLDVRDMVDSASDDIDRKMIEAIGIQDMKRLRLIESALIRIEQDKYGLCMRCGKRIAQTRLEAIPYAIMCIGCQSSEERRNR